MKVLLVDKCTLFSQGLQSILQSDGIEVVGTAQNGEDALAKAGLLKPDAIILNASGEGFDSLEIVGLLSIAVPAAGVVVFAEDKKILSATKRSGASGYLLTEIRGEQLLEKLHRLETSAVK
jgi:DNA-binding NarL/FixJ family response regulator